MFLFVGFGVQQINSFIAEQEETFTWLVAMSVVFDDWGGILVKGEEKKTITMR
jgi:hypothetical protein